MVREVLYPERPLLSRLFREPHDQKRIETWDQRLVRILIKVSRLTRYASYSLCSKLFDLSKTKIISTCRVSLCSTTLAGVTANRSHKHALNIGTASGIV